MSEAVTFEAPEFENCALAFEALGPTRDAGVALAWLPREADGWMATPSAVAALPLGEAREELLLEAEGAAGLTTVRIRFDRGEWRGWRVTEKPGTGYRKVLHDYWTTEATPTRRRATYAAYWKENDLGVWEPAASRFVAFGGER